MYKVIKDNKELFKGSGSECFAFILRHQGNSVDYATKYEGYSIELIVTSCSDCSNELTERESNQPIKHYVDWFLCNKCYYKWSDSQLLHCHINGKGE
tara:strand:+ start:239 stop:529 length:291 start_codon:yes stop_codon:yes gene_type:complete